ncbi:MULTISPECIES: aldo/keto reductase [unclassified Tolypothrix]|uniref:aldo/keto reductase n=1 Tax=unclassified Tolypothrix TaxID=2649714 RepID=UPI0005EAAA84|nr:MULTISPECIES: aldo/keto reductase [unclassified Tolypothrix]BAY95470.1 aldo/keto reductase [Microchaete diplosiphon NIES-3275]EKF00717.1 oxidoreductase, aldo/keto reductase family protein [Tolypothrix sp. PCC 7601]MBE9084607.1 aldo/keto reductase [Tolypothrix sp. LEGE 11397]UYD28628.1 aldo/keto reductase [Tolypothrix sp. PCC 7712]UYD35460.1 aldo/keto reductase [Tolypothrix sp. PCC 7601]
MEKRTLGTSDVKITPILMGTWQAGKRMWVGIEDDDSIKTIRVAFEAGITTIDTAEVYGDGHSERIVAEALSDVRSQVEYATKVFANHLKYDQVIAACERSLKNLKTDYIDLYQIHWPSGAFNTEIVPIEETMKALNFLKEQGKIRAIGVSNFSCEQLAEAAQYGSIDSLQPPYSLFWRPVEKELMPYCVEHQISILAYSPLAQGLLTGKFSPGHQFDPADNRAKNRLFQGENFERAQQALDKLRPIAESHNATLAQLALAWLIAQPQTNAIAGARYPQQAKDNAVAGEIKLSDAEISEIDTIGRIVTDQLDESKLMWEW